MSVAKRSQRNVLISEIMEWRRLYDEEGATIPSLAEQFGRSQATIHRYLHRFGTVRPRGWASQRRKRLTAADLDATVELYDSGLTYEQVGARLGVTQNAIRWRMQQANAPGRDRRTATLLSPHRWPTSPMTEAQVLAMHDAGATQMEVAQAVGLSRTGVRAILTRNDRPHRPRAIGVKRAVAIRKGNLQLMSAPDPATLEPVQRVQRVIGPRPAVTGGSRWDRASGMTGVVASAPLARALLREVSARADLDNPRADVCRSAGIAPRQLNGWAKGEYRMARFDVADRVLTSLEWLWWEVYDPQAYGPGVFRDRQRDDVLAWLDAVDHASFMWTGEGVFGDTASERVAA